MELRVLCFTETSRAATGILSVPKVLAVLQGGACPRDPAGPDGEHFVPLY
jgi:hypothetical protein